MLYQKLSIDIFCVSTISTYSLHLVCPLLLDAMVLARLHLLELWFTRFILCLRMTVQWGDDFLSAGNPDLKMKSIKYDEFHRRKDSEEVTADANFHGQITFQGENIEWDMYRCSTSGSSLNPSRYKSDYQRLM